MLPNDCVIGHDKVGAPKIATFRRRDVNQIEILYFSWQRERSKTTIEAGPIWAIWPNVKMFQYSKIWSRPSNVPSIKWNCSSLEAMSKHVDGYATVTLHMGTMRDENFMRQQQSHQWYQRATGTILETLLEFSLMIIRFRFYIVTILFI